MELDNKTKAAPKTQILQILLLWRPEECFQNVGSKYEGNTLVRASGFAVFTLNELLLFSVILVNSEALHKQRSDSECEAHPGPRGTPVLQANTLQ